MFLVAAATSKELPSPSDEKGIEFSQEGFFPLLCLPTDAHSQVQLVPSGAEVKKPRAGTGCSGSHL